MRNSGDYSKVAGAYVNCYIDADSQSKAEKISRKEISKNNWKIISQEDNYPINAKTISDKGKEYYNQALLDKVDFVYHTYEFANEIGEYLKNDIAVFTTKFVLEDKETITYVSHELQDGAWQFFSDDKFNDYNLVGRVVGFNEILEIDPSLIDLLSLEPGYYAKRSNKNDIWRINQIA